MKKLLFFVIVLLFVCNILYWSRCKTSQQPITEPSLSQHISSMMSKKFSTLFSLIPSKIKYETIWGGVGRVLTVLDPQLKTAEWAGKQIQKAGKFSLITAGLATVVGGSWLLITFFTQIKAYNLIKREIDTISKSLEKIKTSELQPEAAVEQQKNELEKTLQKLTKKTYSLQKLLKKIAVPTILTLISVSLLGHSYGIGYAGDWVRYIGEKLGSWKIPIK